MDLQETVRELVALDCAHGAAGIADLALRRFAEARRTVTRESRAATAELGELCGWLLFDSERHREARRANRAALSLADLPMRWFILSNQAQASVHIGLDREGLRIADDMLCTDLPPRVAALFRVRRARALAALGASGEAEREFGRARAAFLDGIGSRDPSWTWWINERELSWHEGMMRAEWGRGIEELAESYESCGTDPRSRFVYGAHLAEALARARSSEAERIAGEVIPFAGVIGSVRAERALRRPGWWK
ncbi:hypothetical protein [Allokutzneria sp. NRRL B-24872]|uniref:hypothetical protein n=1 Tax=Allokutzneria sp. NRRL B-24872 TaxID=1137961 RepID=UPI000A37A9D3|nr:hypothetical protein [Allokutzneria sp. NRRL B-24872]